MPPPVDFLPDGPPATTFDELGFHPNLLKGIHDLGFLHPTPIQAKAIPPILAGRDVIGSAQTGTGKTAAFVLPIIHRLMSGGSRRRVRALIILPTRELAVQVMEHVHALSKHTQLTGTAIYGGVGMGQQINALSRGVEIIAATPGRLLDHVRFGRIKFNELDVLVLDEADRMLDMGFLPAIKQIVGLLPVNRQNLLFSATMPPEMMSLAQKMLRDPVRVQAGPAASPAAGIRHAVYPVPRHLKRELLMRLLREEGTISALVFTRTKHAADRLAGQLERAGLRVSVMHGDRSQSQRSHALEEFRQGRHQVMVATDVAARGIDVENISHVINFDMPNTPEDYIHRIGRTARAEAKGDAFSLVDRDEEPQVQAIERTLRIALPRVTLPDFDYKQAAPPRSPMDRSSHRPQRPYGNQQRGHSGSPQRGNPRSQPRDSQGTGSGTFGDQRRGGFEGRRRRFR